MKRIKLFFFITILIYAAGPLAVSAGGGFHVALHGNPLTLMGQPLMVGQPMPELRLPDSGLNMVDLNSLKGKVSIISIVPSIDTKVCEKQTHILSEENEGLDQSANLVTVSRDLPFAQGRFAKEAKISNILFLSDYREGSFGKASGLLIKENRLLARAIVVLDKQGIIRHLEVVPDLGKLPQMKKAFEVARSL